MKLLFDENLSYRLAIELADAFPGSVHLRDVGLMGSEDEQVWAYARDRGFIVVSKDADFYHRSMLRGSPPKVIWLRVGNASTTIIGQLLRGEYRVIQDFADSREAAFLILP